MRPSFAVYIDALGTKQVMKSFTDVELRAQLVLMDQLNWFLHAPEWEGELQRFLSFSDNVIVGVPLGRDDTGGYGLGFFLGSVAAYQLHMTLKGRFQRGGIGTGLLYIDDSFVTGPALVDAVTLEQDVAVHPRIVLSEACAAIAVLDGRHYADVSRSPWNSQLLVDGDGRVFVDYLGALTESLDAKQVRAGVAEHRDQVEAALVKLNEPGRIREKYRWAAEYHNYVCDRWALAAKYRVTGLTSTEALYTRSFKTFAEHQPIGDRPVVRSEQRAKPGPERKK